MDYVNAAATGKLLPHVLPIMDLKKMLAHTEETLPPHCIYQYHLKTYCTFTGIFAPMF